MYNNKITHTFDFLGLKKEEEEGVFLIIFTYNHPNFRCNSSESSVGIAFRDSPGRTLYLTVSSLSCNITTMRYYNILYHKKKKNYMITIPDHTIPNPISYFMWNHVILRRSLHTIPEQPWP